MPVTTASAAIHITPVVFKTWFKHYKKKGKKIQHHDKAQVATDDLFFDEGFNIVKSFIEMGTHNTIESLQAFTNTHVPAPPWAAVSPVIIPLSSCNEAADLLIDWFNPDELKHVVGGEKWWQVRGMDGIDGEWITERRFLKDVTPERRADLPEGKKLNSDEEDILKMEELESVMLYVHGGAFFWGSINSHRYQIIRYAREFKGRAFAVNYRKAPQYPWPCPLHDVLAAYFYLTQPPPGALHKSVAPGNIVLAGDSAGGGLCVAALTILRDMGITLPAGAVLISPWVDLTHSFPSIMSNEKTDIIPPHGFIAKPSATWPVHLKQSERVSESKSKPPPVPGHADTLEPGPERVEKSFHQDTGEEVPSQEEMFEQLSESERRTGLPSPSHNRDTSSTAASEPENKGKSTPKDKLSEEDMEDLVDRWQPKPPKVLMNNPEDPPLELKSQIQLYAATEQLTHPLVSPVLQSSLGNLCPLYILAGDGEVLRDEIIYLAHKAAHPEEYPVREGVLRDSPRQVENAKKYTTPTKVHLQVFDDMCHVLTVFSYTDSAKYAYRSIAQFVKHVTLHSQDEIARNPFPEPVKKCIRKNDTNCNLELLDKREAIQKNKDEPEEEGNGDEAYQGMKLYEENKEITAEEFEEENADTAPGRAQQAQNDLRIHSNEKTSEVIMIRERVDIHGKVRPMEPTDKIPALQIPAEEVGLIKEAPVRRWLAGQEIWDKKYSRETEKVVKQRKKIEEKANTMLASARERGLVLSHESSGEPQMPPRTTSSTSVASSKRGFVNTERRWGPLDLEDERPPPTAIAKRRDTPEALALLRKSIWHSAPITHSHVPKRKTADILRAVFDPHDHPVNAPQQSVSEQQVKANIIPMHGMRIWDVLVSSVMRTNAKKNKEAKRAKEGAEQIITAVGDKLSPS